MALGTLNRLTIYALVASQLGLPICGCAESGAARGPEAYYGSAANAASAQRNATLGEIAYRVLRRNLERSTDNAAGKVQALDARKGEFTAAIDTIVPPDLQGSLSTTIEDVVRLVDDGTLPQVTSNLASILELLANDPQDPQRLTLEALAKLSNARAPVDKEQALKLASRLLAYPELEEVLKAVAALVSENDGVDPSGAPNGERDLLGDLLGVVARRLEAIPRPASSAPPPPSRLVAALLEEVEIRGGVQVGAPAWAARADANGNPRVRLDPRTGRIYAPFVDPNADGVADVDSDGDPIDAAGRKIEVPAFGPSGLRDADGRALAVDGALLYEYFDAKRTALGQVLHLAGQLVARHVPLDLLKAIDATSTRIPRQDASGATYIAYADDNPALDLAWAALEINRYRDAPKLLDSLAALIRREPRRAERIMVHLVHVIDILERSQFQGHGSRKLLDDLAPLLDQVFESNGGGQANADSLAKIILDTFRTEIQRMRRIPRGLAEMMKYTDYPSRTPTGPGQKSAMEQLLDMMAEANQCDSWPFGNMAEFYLDAMAGNKRILWFTISVHTINQLLDISFLRSLLCNKISPSNIRALHAFAQSGALDSMIPLAKAFSDRGQTRLLKNIFLTLGANYPTALRPNEPVVVRILESGAVEEVFDALNVLSGMTVPGTGEPVNDVVAQFVAGLVDDDRAVYDRRGRRHMTQLHMLLSPLEEMSARIDIRGVRTEFDRAIRNAIGVALATTMHDNGTPGNPADDYEALLNHGLVKVTAAALEAAAGAMSMDPLQRNRDIARYQQDLVALMTGRDLPVLVDVLLAVERSPRRSALVDATVNLFTPNLTVRHDVYGSVLEVAAAALQARADPQATADVLRFAGRALDPARGWSKPIASGLVKVLADQRRPVLLDVLRNALDRGPSGSSRSAAETLLSILDDIQAQSAQGRGPVTAQSIADAAKKIADFLRDPVSGLESIYAQLRARRR